MHNNCKRSLQKILKEFHLQNYIWFSLFQALWIQRLGLGVRGLRLPSHCSCSTQHFLWRLLQLPVLSWLLNILNIQIFKIFFTASKQLMKFLGLLVCSPKGAKDILFPWLSDYLNEHYPSKHHSNATLPKKPSSQALLNSTNDQFKLFLMITHRRLGKIQEKYFLKNTETPSVWKNGNNVTPLYDKPDLLMLISHSAQKLLKWFMISYFLCFPVCGD